MEKITVESILFSIEAKTSVSSDLDFTVMEAHTGSGGGGSTPSCGPPVKTRP